MENIYQHPGWPHLAWYSKALSTLPGEVRFFIKGESLDPQPGTLEKTLEELFPLGKKWKALLM